MNSPSELPSAPNLDFLRTFVVFAEEGGFAAAARRLALSQAAVHAQVRRLAEDLELELYRRRGRGLELTDDGRETLAFARELLDRCAAFRRERGQHRAPRLALGEGALLYVVAEPLRHAIAAERGVELRVANAPTATRLLLDSEVDLAIVASSNAPTDERLESKAIRHSESVVVMPGRHALARRKSLRIRDLEERPLVAGPEGGRQRVALEALAAAVGVRLNVAVAVPGWPATLHLVRLGAGIAVVNDVCRLPRGLVGVPLEGGPQVTYWLVRRRSATAADALWERLSR